MAHDGHGFASIGDYPALGEVPSCREAPDGRLARAMKMLRPCAGPMYCVGLPVQKCK